MDKRLTKIIFMSTLAAALAVSLAACRPGGTTATTPTTNTSSVTPARVSFSGDIKAIFNAKCVICHQGGSAPGGLSLVSDVAYKNLVNVKSTESPLNRVTPGQPDSSYLMHKLLGTQAQAGGGGARMPFNGIALPPAQLELFQQWITEGAPDN